jgi:hypothetical protein
MQSISDAQGLIYKILRHTQETKVTGMFSFTRRVVGKKEVNHYKYFQQELGIQPMNGDPFTGKSSRNSAIDALMNSSDFSMHPHRQL